MDNKKLKEIPTIVLVGIASIVYSVVACLLGTPSDALDASQLAASQYATQSANVQTSVAAQLPLAQTGFSATIE